MAKRGRGGEFFSELMVGVFMVAVLALLAYFTIIVAGVDIMNGTQTRHQRISVMFEDVGGLKERDSVVMRGMPVGTVEGMSLEGRQIRVNVNLRKPVELREGYRFSVCSGSLLGGNYLLIEEGEGAVLPAGASLVGETPKQWMRDLGEVVADLREATKDGHLKSIITNLDATAESLREVSSRLENGEGTLGKLFSNDMALYNDLSNAVNRISSIAEKIDSGENSVAQLINDSGESFRDLRDSIANVKAITERLEQGEGTLGRLLSSDDTIYRDIQDMVAALKETAVRLENGEGALGKLLKDDDPLYNDLSDTVANLKIVTDRLANGEGTLGKLSADSELYDDVHGLIQDVRQTVDNFRDTTPISAFSSLIMGGL